MKRLAIILLHLVAVGIAVWILWGKGLIIGPVIFFAIYLGIWIWIFASAKRKKEAVSHEQVLGLAGGFFGLVMLGVIAAFVPFLLIWCFGMFFFGWPPLSNFLRF